MVADGHDVIRSGPELVNSATGIWLTPADITSSLVVFVHGFTSHGRYLQTFADYVRGYGYVGALFNYDSYLGIDTAALALQDRLRPLTAALTVHRGFALVAHSMGGLVARHFARVSSGMLLGALRGMALLGTPNRGALAGGQYLSFMLDWSDHVSGINPFARTPFCAAATQMLLGDGPRIIEVLNDQDRIRPVTIPVISISGGLNVLEWGRNQNSIGLKLRNATLQQLIGEVPNDGLVAESSSDIRSVIRAAKHVNNYAEYPRINHTNLVQSQAVADIVIGWLASDVF